MTDINLDPQAFRQDVRRGGLQEIGRTGLPVWGGRVYEEWLPELLFDRGIRAYKAMRDNEPVVGASLLAIENLIRRVEWNVKAASTSPIDEAAALFYRQCLFDDLNVAWSDVISEILTFFPFGWSYFEIVYKYRQGDVRDPRRRSRFNDGRMGIRKIAPRAQETLDHWEFDEAGGVAGMWQIPPPAYDLVYLPIEKALHFRTTQRKGNPEGVSCLRRAWRAYYLKTRLENIEGIGIERGLAGIPVMWVPMELLSKNATPEQQAIAEECKKIATNIKRDEQEGILMPLDYTEKGDKRFDITLLATADNHRFDTSAVITRYESRIAMSLLTDFMLLGHERIGSYALAVDKTNMFTIGLCAFLDAIADTFNRHCLPRLKRLNPAITGNAQLMHKGIEVVDVKSLVESIKMLSDAQFDVNKPEILAWILKLMKAPVPQNASADRTSNRPGEQDGGNSDYAPLPIDRDLLPLQEENR